MSATHEPDWQHARRLMAQLGPHYASDIARNSQRVKELYAPLLRTAHEGIAITRDLAYGPDPRQVLDIFRPAGAAGAGVLVFVHGGAFVRGARSVPEGVYDNVLLWFARRGFVGVNVEYRLAPGAAYPEGAADVARAMDWVHAHIAGHGGDPARVLLMGHSAGGTHVATYACDPVLDTPCRARALVLVSARLRADRSPRNPNAAGVAAYFGDDASLDEARSPVTHAARCPVPVCIVVAEYENPLLDLYGVEFAARLAAKTGALPRLLQCRHHNHMSVVAHFDSGEDALGLELLDFWASVRVRSPSINPSPACRPG